MLLHRQSLQYIQRDNKMNTCLLHSNDSSGELEKQLTQAQFFFIDGNKVHDKKTLFAEFSDKLQFPSYFGSNWDAFADFLMDMSWLAKNNSYLIIYQNSDVFKNQQPEEWKIANEIWHDAIDYWHQQEKTMMVVFA